MNGIKKEPKGRQKVLFDEVVSTLPGGAFFNSEEAKKIFDNKIIPAGSLVYQNEGKYIISKSATTGTAIGLTREDVSIDDYPSVTVVIAGTVRKAVLEEAVASVVSENLKRITLI